MRVENSPAAANHSMVAPLRRVLVCAPRAAGWDRPEQTARWQELGFLHAPDFAAAQSQHDVLCRELKAVGAEVLELPASPSLTLDAVYAHDASLPSDFGMIVLRPGKKNRTAEGVAHKAFFANENIPVFAETHAPGTTEAGDIVWLNDKVLLVGRSYRTNTAGLDQLRESFAPKGVQVVSVPLPHGAGPSACLHLMSLISLLDEKTILADLSSLTVETVELLLSYGYKFIEIDASERETLACNVLALGNNRLLAIQQNHKTNQRLHDAGFDVRTFPGSELCVNGSGGPTCLTRPLRRG